LVDKKDLTYEEICETIGIKRLADLIDDTIEFYKIFGTEDTIERYRELFRRVSINYVISRDLILDMKNSVEPTTEHYADFVAKNYTKMTVKTAKTLGAEVKA